MSEKDVESQKNGKNWVYSDTVKEHFFNPRNIALKDEEIENMNANAVGEVGSPACGDVMKMWLRIENGIIKDCKWKTFGCASAIASTSMLSTMITENGGMSIEDAEKIKPKDILERLGGLPTMKIHCSVLGDQALREAIKNYREQEEKN